MKLGDKVKCTGYITKTGLWFKVYPKKETPENICDVCVLVDQDGKEDEIDSWARCDKYIVKSKLFTGIYVGITNKYTKFDADYVENEYSDDGWIFSSVSPQKFAVVYYAENKKRLVPLDMVEEVGK